MTKDQHKSTLIRIPAPLVESVKDLLTLNREGKQEAVLQGLQELVTNLKQSGYHIVPGGNQYGEILERLEKLERTVFQPSNNRAVTSELPMVTIEASNPVSVKDGIEDYWDYDMLPLVTRQTKKIESYKLPALLPPAIEKTLLPDQVAEVSELAIAPSVDLPKRLQTVDADKKFKATDLAKYIIQHPASQQKGVALTESNLNFKISTKAKEGIVVFQQWMLGLTGELWTFSIEGKTKRFYLIREGTVTPPAK